VLLADTSAPAGLSAATAGAPPSERAGTAGVLGAKLAVAGLGTAAVSAALLGGSASAPPSCPASAACSSAAA
jgi:hypothetical protein